MAMALCAGPQLRPAYGVEEYCDEKLSKIAVFQSVSVVLDPMPPSNSVWTPIDSHLKSDPHLPFIESQQ